jgi:hypothetical protein
MPSVSISEKKVWVGDTPVSLLSGEVHYWRLDPNSWRAALERVREMGIKTVATYACWDYHQIAPGQYDFTGVTDPRRNMVGFLELLTEMDFWIIFRPGPYIYSEWSNNGVPDKAAQYHRLDPRFHALAEHYMAAVTECARPFLASTGGKIILWQADNEIDPWPHLYTEAIGLGRTLGIFHDYLRERYAGDVSALNAAWRTNYTDFDQARAVSEMFREDPVLLARYIDYRTFLHWYVNKVAAWSVGVYRNLGVDVPVILNAYSGVGTQVWAELEKIADLVGSDIYPSNEHLYRTGEQRHILEAVRYSRTFSKVPYVAEFEAGIWHDWLGDVGTLSPNHYRLICLSVLQAGVAGWNWYMLVNRDNWYQSPINEWGRTRPPLFEAFRQITALFDEVDPTTLEKVTQTAVTFDPMQRSTTRPGQDLLQSFHDADIDYEFFDLTNAMTDKPVTFYAGGSWLSEASQRKLVEYVENGGHLICVGAYPKQDEHMHPLNLLDIPEPDGIVTGQGQMTLFLGMPDLATIMSPPEKYYEVRLVGHMQSPWFFNYGALGSVEDDFPIVGTRVPNRMQASEELVYQFSLQENLHYGVGFTRQRGKGFVTVVGLQPSAGLICALHRHFGVEIACRSLVSGITSGLFRRGDDYYLIATNDGSESKGVVFELPALTGTWRVRNLEGGASQDLANHRLTLIMPRKDSVILHLSRAEDAP